MVCLFFSGQREVTDGVEIQILLNVGNMTFPMVGQVKIQYTLKSFLA